MKNKSKLPFECPICGNQVAFTGLLARIKAIHFHQTHPGRWRRISRAASGHDAWAIIALVCESCGHPSTPPGGLAMLGDKRPR